MLEFNSLSYIYNYHHLGQFNDQDGEESQLAVRVPLLTDPKHSHVPVGYPVSTEPYPSI